MILKLEEETSDLNSTFDFHMETYTSPFDECLYVSDTLVDEVVKVKYVTCPILKPEIQTLKRQLTYAISLCTSNDRGAIFKKNSQVARRNKRSISSKGVFHYFCDKGHIKPFCLIINV